MSILTKLEERKILKEAEEKKKMELGEAERQRLNDEIKKYERKVKSWKTENEMISVGQPASIRFLRLFHNMQKGNYVNYEKAIKAYRLREVMDKIDEIGLPGIPVPQPSDEVAKELKKREKTRTEK